MKSILNILLALIMVVATALYGTAWGFWSKKLR